MTAFANFDHFRDLTKMILYIDILCFTRINSPAYGYLKILPTGMGKNGSLNMPPNHKNTKPHQKEETDYQKIWRVVVLCSFSGRRRIKKHLYLQFKIPPNHRHTNYPKRKALEGFWSFGALVAEKRINMPQNHGNTKVHQKEFIPVPEELDGVGKKIVHAAYLVHRALGPGLLEKVYEICFCHELQKMGLSVNRQIDIPIIYDGITFNEGLRLDVLVEDEVICEIKAVDIVNPVWEAQVLSHLKLTGNRLGYLINFNVVNIGQGIQRFVR